MSITSSYGFRSAQTAWENASPYGDECDCPPLFRCENCETYANEAGTCTECTEQGEPEIVFEELDRDESTEGILTDSRCNLHNHVCRSRDCCD
jgi:hypothetical protein